MFHKPAGEKATLSEGMATISISNRRALLGKIESGQILALHDPHCFIEKHPKILSVGRGILTVKALINGISKAKSALKVFFIHRRMPTRSFQSFFGIRHHCWGKLGSHPTRTDHVGRTIHRNVSGKSIVVGAL